MTDLDKLIEAVEAGKWNYDAAARWLWRKDGKFYGWAHSSFEGSLDAAKALHDALLPAFRFRIEDCYVSVWYGTSGPFDSPCDPYGNHARAWLIAILKAYRSQQ